MLCLLLEELKVFPPHRPQQVECESVIPKSTGERGGMMADETFQASQRRPRNHE